MIIRDKHGRIIQLEGHTAHLLQYDWLEDWQRELARQQRIAGH